MNKYCLIAFLLPAFVMSGQTKLGLSDRIELGEMLASSRSANGSLGISEPRVSIFARIADDSAIDALRAAGAEIQQREGDIVLLSTPVSKVEAVVSAEGVVTASLSKKLNTYAWSSPYGSDKSRTSLQIDKVLSGSSPLPAAYNGEGVVVGIVDAGIDVHHINFKDADGNHRVKHAQKHAVMGNSTFTLVADTPEKMAKFTTDIPEMTHGTHVMGIAAGSFKADAADAPDFRGAAPGADIAVSCGASDNAHLIKGVRGIINYAKSVGKPVVINISMGNNEGPHDGSDEVPAALANMAKEEGVVLCVAAGNEGAEKSFLYADFSEENTTLRTFITPTQYTAYAWGGLSLFPQAIGMMEVWSEDSTPFTLTFDVIDRSTGKAVVSYTIPQDGLGAITSGGTPTIPLKELVDDNEQFNSIYFNSTLLGEGGVYAGNNRYHADVSVRLETRTAEDFQRYVTSLRIEGTPGQKIYIYGQPTNQIFSFAFEALGVEGFADSTGDGSFSSLAGAEGVICVGSYVSHNFNRQQFNQYTVGATAPYSSWGHAPGGRLLPHIKAPGTLIVSSMSNDYHNSSAFNAESDLLYYSYQDAAGKTHHWIPMSGTSMATPYMTGVAATWLSADPTLTSADIVSIAQETSGTPLTKMQNDGASGTLNAFRGLCKILNLSGVNDVAADVSTPLSIVALGGNHYQVQAPTAKKLNAKLVSINGSEVLSLAAKDQVLGVDLSAIASGLYLLTATDGVLSKTEKILVK